MDDMGIFEAMLSQRQFIRYKPDPVPQEALARILEAATMAPNGANTQPWEFIVCTGEMKNRLANIIRENVIASTGRPRTTHITPESERAFNAARTLSMELPNVPVLIVVAVDYTRGWVPYDPANPPARFFYDSSILLAVQNLFLAARALGLGTRLTYGGFMNPAREKQFKEILGVPEHVELSYLTPLGYPVAKFSRPPRRPWQEVTSFNTWGGRTVEVDGKSLI